MSDSNPPPDRSSDKGNVRGNLRLRLIFAAVVVAVCSLPAEVLSIQALRADESVVLVYRSVGCFHHIERFYEIRGGDTPTFGIVEHMLRTEDGTKVVGGNRTLGSGALTKGEQIGLDSYLVFLRHGYGGGCTTRDYINLGYYRNGQLIGEEKFIDATCRLTGFKLKNGKVTPPVDQPGINPYPADFPKAVFAEIVPPWLVEKRIEQARKTPIGPARAGGR